jgi:hypothetical protein
MISERQEWTFGQALEYALDALELALAGVIADNLRGRRFRR